MQAVFERFKELADKKKEVYDGDIIALVQQQLSGEVASNGWSLVDFEVTSGSGRKPRVKLTLTDGAATRTETVEQGDGPIDAAFFAVERITGTEVVCKDFRVRSATLGRDAQGEVTVEIEHRSKMYRGVGFSTDTVEATILAMLNAINRIRAEAAAQS